MTLRKLLFRDGDARIGDAAEAGEQR